MTPDFPGYRIPAEQADLWWSPHFLTASQADEAFEALRSQIAWEQGQIRMFGKWVMEPRLSAWYGDPGAAYTYSGKRQEPLDWISPLAEVKELVEQASGGAFNSVLLNLYRFGQDSMGWHSDDEKELGDSPMIASLNLGATRKFQLRRKDDKAQKIELELSHGSLLIMAGETQTYWQHQVPKTKKTVGERLNLTFRQIIVD